MTTRTYIRDNRGRFARNPERETDMTRMIYVVNWTPEGVGGFDWRWSKDDAERQALVLAVNSASTVNMHEVELPDEVGDDPEGITAWLDSEGWSDGGDPRIAERLEYLRGEIRAERISQGEVIELQGLAKHIDQGDVELLEWAGVPEFPEDPQVVEVTTPSASFDRSGKHTGVGRWLDLVHKVNEIRAGTISTPLETGVRVKGYGDASVEVYMDAYVVHHGWQGEIEDMRVTVASRTPEGARLIRQAAEALGLHFEVEGC